MAWRKCRFADCRRATSLCSECRFSVPPNRENRHAYHSSAVVPGSFRSAPSSLPMTPRYLVSVCRCMPAIRAASSALPRLCSHAHSTSMARTCVPESTLAICDSDVFTVPACLGFPALVCGPVDRSNMRFAIGASFRSANARISDGSTTPSNVAPPSPLPYCTSALPLVSASAPA